MTVIGIGITVSATGISGFVSLARVLLQLSPAEESPLLLWDEPVSAQDIGQQHQILNLVKSLCLQNGLVMISILHDLNQTSRYADKVWLLHQGELIAQGSPLQVLQPETVMKIWVYQPELIFNSQASRYCSGSRCIAVHSP